MGEDGYVLRYHAVGRLLESKGAMIARRSFLAGMAGMTSAALVAPARAAAVDRDIVLFVFHDMGFMREVGARRGIAEAVRRGTHFSRAFSATASPLAALPILRSGLYAHQLGQRGQIHSPWAKSGVPAPDYQDSLKSLGYAAGRFETAMTKGERQSGLRSLFAGGSNVCAEFNVRAMPGHDADAALQTADALLVALPKIWRAQRRGPPLVLLVGTGPVASTAHAVEPPIDLCLAVPGGPEGSGSSALVSSVDIVPTLLGWGGGVSLAAALPGRSLLALASAGSTPDEAVFASHDNVSVGHFAPVRAIRTRKFRLVHRMPTGGGVVRDPQAIALYHLDDDPDCKVNLIGREDFRGHAARLETLMRRYRRETDDPLQSV